MTERQETLVLAGNPNVGKTTLFNALTGSTAKVGNYAGVTVSIRSGHFFTPQGRKVRLVDLPGCYSLEGGSPDQELAKNFLTGQHEGEPKPDLAVCVVDASNLERNLVLAMEVLETGLPVVLVLNMVDDAEKSGLRLDPQKLSEELGVPVVPMEAVRKKGLVELKQALRHPFPAPPESLPWSAAADLPKARREFAIRTANLAARRPDAHSSTFSDKLDAELLHPVRGWFYLVTTMLVVFWTIFSFASIPMDWIETGFGALKDLVEKAMPEGDLRDLLTGGIIEGVGAVIVFLPQILMLFFFIGLLESSGYMSRAAFLMDGLMAKVGLSGKAFLPLLSSYACAIPGVMATRTIDSAKERLVTIAIAPWMSCSARLPVYLLLVPMLLGGSEGGLVQALVLTLLYIIGTVTAFLAARILRGKLGADTEVHHFILELPPYRGPQWSYVFRHLAERGWAFMRKAGTLILGLMILLWAAQTYPKSDSEDPGERLDHSLVGRISHAIEPVVRPLGFDGRTGTAILTSFAAREVFVGSMAQLYSIEEAEDDTETRQKLRERLAAETRPDGTKLFRPLTVISLLLFFIYALQCLPTSAVVARESGSWKWAAGQFVFMSLFAIAISLIVFQTGSALGF